REHEHLRRKFGPRRTKPRKLRICHSLLIISKGEASTSTISLPFTWVERGSAGEELIGELTPNQFFYLSRQLPVAIAFNLELRLTHGLRLREALVILFTSIIHANDG
ncbi:hypothetical protein PIB30_026762, partial [Stylosanthes scabra]|nr:hypothetical protein [Stylosanthes scabra]